MENVLTSACPLNCWDSCGFHVTVKDNKVVKVDGDPTHPITKGKICGRGRMLEAKTNSPERLVYPLKKIDGEFIQISWEQALDEIASKLQMIKEQDGPKAVLHSHDYANNGLLKNLDKRFFNSFGGVTELVGSLCWGAGIEAQKWDFGDSYSHAPDDLQNSQTVVVWGRNVARTNMHLFEALQAAKKRGATIYVIDPIYNATAKMAHQYVSVKPGMDGLLALGIMKRMVQLQLEDKAFIKDNTFGYDTLQQLINDITIEEIIEKTEVPLKMIDELAFAYHNGPTATLLGLGMQRYANGGNTIRMIDALVAISGNVGVPGGGANYGNLQVGQSFAWEELLLSSKETEKRQFTMMKQAEEVLKARVPEIKMIIVTCGNPLVQVPNTNLVKKAFTSVDTLVVIDHFMTDTAQIADYVLPTTTVFEEEDVYFASMYHHYVQYGPKLVDAPGEAQSDLWIWSELAERLGFGDDFNFTRDDYLSMGLAPLNSAGITLEKLKQCKHMELPVDHVPWFNRKFKTPSGKYEFFSQLGESKGYDGRILRSLPLETKWTNESLAKKYPYTLLTIHPLRSNHSQHYPLLKVSGIKVEVSKDIAERHDLIEGDIVKVWNERGEVRGKVQILQKSHTNVINIDEGAWSIHGGSVNLLTPDGESDNHLGSILYDCLVNIEKL